jgi:oligopeptidase B
VCVCVCVCVQSNSVKDFVTCTKHLLATENIDRSKVSAFGDSAGGLLVAAAINQAPHLFRSAILVVPFVDVLATMRDPTLPLTIHEYDEWGNPEAAEHFHNLYRLDPLLQLPSSISEIPNLLSMYTAQLC